MLPSGTNKGLHHLPRVSADLGFSGRRLARCESCLQILPRHRQQSGVQVGAEVCWNGQTAGPKRSRSISRLWALPVPDRDHLFSASRRATTWRYVRTAARRYSSSPAWARATCGTVTAHRTLASMSCGMRTCVILCGRVWCSVLLRVVVPHCDRMLLVVVGH